MALHLVRVDAVGLRAGDELVGVEMSKRIELTDDLVEAIRRYLETDWNRGDPSRLGALNAVAYIGEKVVVIYARALKSESEEGS